MNRFFFIIIQFLLHIHGTEQSRVRQTLSTLKVIGNTMKKPVMKTFGNTITNSMSILSRNKNTIKNFAFGIQEKYLTSRNNVGIRAVKYLGEEGIKKVAHVAPQAVRGGKQNIMMKSAAQMSGKGIRSMIKRSGGKMIGSEIRSLINMAYINKPQLPLLFAAGGLNRLTAFNLVPGNVENSGQSEGKNDSVGKVEDIDTLTQMQAGKIPKLVPKNGMNVLHAGQDNLGEGCTWHPEFKKFFWVDIHKHKFSELDPKTLQRKDFNVPDNMLTTLAPKKGGFVTTTHYGGFADFEYPGESPDVKLKHWSSKTPVDEAIEDSVRFNDGKVDPKGRMVGGTMNMVKKNENSHFYIMDSKNSKPRLLVKDLITANGPNWSPDGKKFYYIDTRNPPPNSADYDLEKGTVSNKTPLLDNIDNDFVGGGFDGATVDNKGFIWWAIFRGAKVVKIDPNERKIVSWIDLSEHDVRNPTDVCFGGDDYRTMFITSECYQPGSKNDLRGVGNNGSCVVIKFDESEGVQGVPPNSWNGN